MKLLHKVGALGLILVVVAAVGLFAQVKRAVIYTGDVSVARTRGSAGPDTHPGDEMSYILAGQADISMEGQPIRHIKAGDGFVVTANTKHELHNTGTQPLKLIAVFIVEKGKPLVTPAP